MVELSKDAELGKTTPRFKALLRGIWYGQSRSVQPIKPTEVEESVTAKRVKVIQRIFGDYIGGGAIKHFPSDPDSPDMIWLTKEVAGADGQKHAVKLAGVSNQGKIIMPDGYIASEPETVSWGLPLLGEIQTRLNQVKEKSIAEDPNRVGDVDAILNNALINTAVKTVERELNDHTQASSVR